MNKVKKEIYKVLLVPLIKWVRKLNLWINRV